MPGPCGSVCVRASVRVCPCMSVCGSVWKEGSEGGGRSGSPRAAAAAGRRAGGAAAARPGAKGLSAAAAPSAAGCKQRSLSLSCLAAARSRSPEPGAVT